MTEERSKQEKKAEAASSAQPPKAKKNPNKKTAEPAAEANAKAGDASEAFLLTREEIDTLILEHADLQLRCKEYQDKFLLLAAEFENFKKRTNKDQQRYRELYKENLLSELLPVIDDIERALAHHSDDELRTGFTMIHSKLLAYLENYGVVPFVSVGEEFDPEKHNAMLTRSLEGTANHTVIEEFEKGYMIGNKVLRHAKVIVNMTE